MDSLLQYIVNNTTTLDFNNSLLSRVYLLLLVYRVGDKKTVPLHVS